MNDNTIIKTISKIYFIITSFLLFIFLTLLATFIILQNGLYIDKISLPNLKIKQLYIKWNEKLDISLKEIKIIKNKEETASKIDTENIYKTIVNLSNYYKLFEKITIEKIIIDDITASINFEKGIDGYIVAKSPTLELQSVLVFDSDNLNIKIKTFNDKKRDIKINGNIVLSSNTNDITSSLNINIHDDISLNIYANANKEKFFYKIDSQKDIKSITHTMELFNLHKNLRYWAYEAIGFSSLSIEKLYGWGEFNKLNEAYKNLYASLDGKDLTYAYNKNLDSIHTKNTKVEFKKGVFYIHPNLPKSYNSELGESWLKIDLTTKEELLTLYLLFDGKLDKETLGILKQYKIDVPFLQNSGLTKTNLTLKVNLQTIDVDAKGEFFTKKSNFRYKGFDIDIFDAYIRLDNYDVKINNMLAKYKNLASANVNVRFNAKDKAGTINLDIQKIDFVDNNIYINAKNTPLKVTYILSKNQDKINIDKSFWSIKNHQFDIEKISLPFDLDTMKVSMPSTLISSKKDLKAYISGIADFKNSIYDLNIDLKKFNLYNVELMQSSMPLILKYKNGLSLESNKIAKFKIGSLDSSLNKATIYFKNNKLEIKNTDININNTLKSKFDFTYDSISKTGYLESKEIKLLDNNQTAIYLNKEKTRFDVSMIDKDIVVNSKDLSTSLLYNNDIWKIRLDSLSKIAKDSTVLKKYKIEQGRLSLYKNSDDDKIRFNSNIKYPYKIFVVANNEIEDYTIKGSFNAKTKNAYLNINELIDIKIENDINVSMRGVGINTNAIVDIIDNFDDDTSQSTNKRIRVEAKNSNLYISKDRRIISQDMHLEYFKNVLKAELKYLNGSAKFKYEDGKFYAFGGKFNDQFMENLFSLSRFNGGNFDFAISGSPKEYDGIFTVNNTVIVDYKILNNILAFVNTIPSLVTFAMPGYSSKGLKVDTAYMKFSAKDNLFNISDIYLDSKELDILGHGKVSIKENYADLILNLKTDVGSKLSKVPVVGHLLMGEDSVSTTLSITGPLNDPNIKSLIAKEMAVAPLNILKRTISLPYYLINKEDNISTEK